MNETCPNCQTLFRNAERSEDGTPEIPEQIKCAYEGCEVYLCPEACRELSFVCGGCDQRFCAIHPVFVLSGEKFCGPCFLETDDTANHGALGETDCSLEESPERIGRSA